MRVIGFDEVRQFVDDDVVDYIIRREEQARGEVEVAFAGAATPVGMVVFERDLIIWLLKMPRIQRCDALLDGCLKIFRDNATQQFPNGIRACRLAHAQVNRSVFEPAAAGGFVCVANIEGITALANSERIAGFVAFGLKSSQNVRAFLGLFFEPYLQSGDLLFLFGNGK